MSLFSEGPVRSGSYGVCLVQVLDDLRGLEHLHPGVGVREKRHLEGAGPGLQTRPADAHTDRRHRVSCHGRMNANSTDN